MIRERQREGIAIAKNKGVYKGRKPALDEAAKATLREMIERGVPKVDIARTPGILRASVYQASEPDRHMKIAVRAHDTIGLRWIARAIARRSA